MNTWSSDNTIGGTGALEPNVVSGNGGEGIEMSHGVGTNGNRIVGNRIGSNLAATAAPAFARNSQNGVKLEGVEPCDAVCPPDSGKTTSPTT